MEIVRQIDIYQIFTAAIALTVAGVIGFWCKDVPLKLWGLIKRECTTTVYITSTHISFYNLMSYLEENYKDKNFRNFKVTNGKWGDEETATIGIGYGVHFIKFNKSILYIRLDRQESHGTSLDKETITITKLGRSRKELDLFFAAISVDREKEKMLQVYKMRDYWCPVNQTPKRSMDTIFIKQALKDMIIKTIDIFLGDEQWYLDNGIPYQLGILLHGKPGTGKSSLIRAIATYLNYDIYILSAQNLHRIDDAMSSLPKKSIIVIEDIDCDKIVHSRENKPLDKINPDVANNTISFASLSDVLNAIDGICSVHGRIMIITTNHPEKLDNALLRPGRVDLDVEVGYVNEETFGQFSRRFFSKDDTDVLIKDQITCSKLQSLLLQKKPYDEIVDFVRK